MAGDLFGSSLWGGSCKGCMQGWVLASASLRFDHIPGSRDFHQAQEFAFRTALTPIFPTALVPKKLNHHHVAMLKMGSVLRNPLGAHNFNRVVPVSTVTRPIQFQRSHSVRPRPEHTAHLELQNLELRFPW